MFDEKNGELWSPNTKDYLFHFDPPISTLWMTIFWPSVVLPFKFLRVLQNDQGLLTHVTSGTGVAQQFLTIKIRKLLQNSVNFGPLTKEFTRLMFTHPK